MSAILSTFDRDGMKNGLRDANDLLLPTDNPVLVRARYLCYGVADDDFTVMELKYTVVRNENTAEVTVPHPVL